MTRKRPAMFRGRHFEDVIILLCGRRYLRYSLTYRDLEEIMLERNLSNHHVTIWRWVQRYAPVWNLRIRREMRRPNRSWRVDDPAIRPVIGFHFRGLAEAQFFPRSCLRRAPDRTD